MTCTPTRIGHGIGTAPVETCARCGHVFNPGEVRYTYTFADGAQTGPYCAHCTRTDIERVTGKEN
jgi:hypothetical protein